MRVGIYLPLVLRRYSIDFEGYALALREAGHEPLLVCPGAEAAFPGELVVYAGDQPQSPEFWRQLRLDRAIFYNWFRNPGVLAAAKSAGIRVITRADSDGLISARVFPGESYRRLVDPARGPLDFLRRWRHFLNWHFFYWRSHDKEALQVIELSDRVAVETPAALDNFRRFLDFHRRAGLAEKFDVVPHAVPDLFIHAEIGRAPRKDIFCGGRWDDDQKNARLLRNAVPGILRRLPHATTYFAGPGAEDAFGTLRKEFSRVQVLGTVDRDKLPALFAGCQFLLSSSRWESHPIGALEALCCGCTVVSTPTPGFQAIVNGGTFGTLAPDHSTAGLVCAAAREAAAWEAGRRIPDEIASHWRAEVSHKQVVNQLLAL